MSKSKKEKKYFFYPALGKSVLAYSREEANQQVSVEFKEEKDKAYDLNGDGKIDEKDFSKAGKTLNKAKKA